MSDIRTFEVLPTWVLKHAYCDCGGVMSPTGEAVFLTNPIHIEHKCQNCGNLDSFTDKYPILVMSHYSVVKEIDIKNTPE